MLVVGRSPVVWSGFSDADRGGGGGRRGLGRPGQGRDGLVKCSDPFGCDQEGLVGVEPRVGERVEVAAKAFFELTVSDLLPPQADQRFDPVVDAGKLAAALERPDGLAIARPAPPAGWAAARWY